MTKPRVPETDHGIQGIDAVNDYDLLQRDLRDKGWIETSEIIRCGINEGHALEVGHGPGYLGLEWLKNTRDTRLTGLDISPDMTTLAQKNAGDYGLQERVHYDGGRGDQLPYEDNSFDAVFTNGSLHEWAHPEDTFNEIYRVLKPGGRYFISDLRRDMPGLIRWLLSLTVKPACIRPYWFSSVDASYTQAELHEMTARTHMKGAVIGGNLITNTITGIKG